MDSLSVFTFTAQASDPDGDPVSYQWIIRGGSYAGQTVRLTFLGGTISGRVTATDTKGASASADMNTAIVGSMTGTWRLNPTLYPTWLWDFTLRQTGLTISGTFIDNIYGNGTLDPAEPAVMRLLPFTQTFPVSLSHLVAARWTARKGDKR